MLKISQLEPAHHCVGLRLEGHVIGPWVAELRQSCEPLFRTGRTLRLHLAGVDYLDAEGVALLVELRSRGAALTDPPPYVAEQLKLAGSPE